MARTARWTSGISTMVATRIASWERALADAGLQTGRDRLAPLIGLDGKRLASEIVLLHRGRVIESGPADAFFCAPRSEDARRFIAGELLV